MPLYNYQCLQCQKIFEVRATFKEKDAGLEPECPACQSMDTRQVLTTGMLLHLRGDGGRGPVCGSNSGPGCCG
ncbi:MAG: zinc ribbon domain-containing protein [Chloroflexota bacterium]|nr:MAG: zinc ribbon domain-containing protein [Chloroflexota bacterium]